MVNFGSKNLQFVLRVKYFFLNQLFYSFKYWFKQKNNSKNTLFQCVCGVLSFFVLFCIGFESYAQQTAIFSQYMFNQLTINPAYAGSSELVNLFATSRQQWVGATGGPKTTVFAIDAPIDPFGTEAGIGLNFSNDQIGFSEEIAVNLIGSIRFRLNTGVLNAGLSLGMINHVIDPDFYLGDKNGLSDDHSDQDPLMLTSKESATAMDLGMGAYYSWDDGYIGVSAMHLLNPEPEFDGEYYFYFKRTWFLSGGYKFALVDKPIVFKPSIMMETDGASFQTDINLLTYYKKRYWGGIGYRLQDAVMLSVGIELKNGLKIGYTYDVPASAFSRNYGGSHELALGYQFDLRIDKKGKGYKSVRFL